MSEAVEVAGNHTAEDVVVMPPAPQSVTASSMAGATVRGKSLKSVPRPRTPLPPPPRKVKAPAATTRRAAPTVVAKNVVLPGSQAQQQGKSRLFLIFHVCVFAVCFQ